MIPAHTLQQIFTKKYYKRTRDRRAILRVGGGVSKIHRTLSVLAFLGSGAAFGQGFGNITFTTSTAEVDTVATTNATQTVNSFSTEIKARMQGGGYIYDQTFAAAFSDPTVTSAIAAARSVLTGAGSANTVGPTQLSSVSTPSSTTNTVTTGTVAGTPVSVTTEYIGPITVLLGDLGVCPAASLVGTPPPANPSGCAGGMPGVFTSGQIDFDTRIVTPVTINQTTTTTNTTLLTQVYELVGFPSGVSATPAPPAFWLALLGLCSVTLWLASRRRRSG